MSATFAWKIRLFFIKKRLRPAFGYSKGVMLLFCRREAAKRHFYVKNYGSDEILSNFVAGMCSVALGPLHVSNETIIIYLFIKP